MEGVVQVLNTADLAMNQEKRGNKQVHQGGNKTIKASKIRNDHTEQSGAFL